MRGVGVCIRNSRFTIPLRAIRQHVQKRKRKRNPSTIHFHLFRTSCIFYQVKLSLARSLILDAMCFQVISTVWLLFYSVLCFASLPFLCVLPQQFSYYLPIILRIIKKRKCRAKNKNKCSDPFLHPNFYFFFSLSLSRRFIINTEW